MFTFNLTNLITKKNKKDFEPLIDTSNEKFPNYRIPSACQIRKTLHNLSRCPNCHFLIFDNYWSNDIENPKSKVCTTCGYKI